MEEQSNPSKIVQVHNKSKKKRYNLKKKQPPRPRQRQNDIYITSKSNFKAQLKRCEDLLNSGLRDIYLHCIGSAINRGINLALTLINNSNNCLTYAANTSTIDLVDELHPLRDDDDIIINHRNNSALHIKISRSSFPDEEVIAKK